MLLIVTAGRPGFGMILSVSALYGLQYPFLCFRIFGKQRVEVRQFCVAEAVMFDKCGYHGRKISVVKSFQKRTALLADIFVLLH